MEDQFKRQYLGKFPDDKIYKTLIKTYHGLNSKHCEGFNLSSVIVKQSIDAIKYGSNPEEVLSALIEYMAEVIKHSQKQLVLKNQNEIKPIVLKKRG